LGDKFCLTDDHEVLTDNGWKSIALVTKEDKVCQLNKETTASEFVHPLDTYIFEHSGEMYLIQTTEGSHYVTDKHRVYVKTKEGNYTFIVASLLYILQNAGYSFITQDMREVPIIKVDHHLENKVGDKVYCISVPHEVFLVRRHGELTATWTGNSNRHGQKGTIGALLRGHDMPRTASGIIPDMIMNPHAIPSRMTIAQNLEQLLGKTSAVLGAIGDGTAFMNDGSPQEEIGSILKSGTWISNFMAATDNLPFCIAIATANKQRYGFPLIFVNKMKYLRNIIN
jgi:hypothetical protein